MNRMDSNAPALKFENPVFNEGTNVSVRRGVKWDYAPRTVALADLDGNILGWVEIQTKVMRFCDLLGTDIVNEHDPDCRTLGGLSRSMQKVYPGFRSQEVVTVVSFEYHE